MWAILSVLYLVDYKEHAYRISKYEKYIHTLNFDNIEFLVKTSDIPKFMKQYKNISTNAYVWNKYLYPLYVLDVFHDKHINLLTITDSQKYHYTWIKDFGRIMYNNSKHKSKNYACYRCLQSHSVKKKSHMKIC